MYCTSIIVIKNTVLHKSVGEPRVGEGPRRFHLEGEVTRINGRGNTIMWEAGQVIGTLRPGAAGLPRHPRHAGLLADFASLGLGGSRGPGSGRARGPRSWRAGTWRLGMGSGLRPGMRGRSWRVWGRSSIIPMISNNITLRGRTLILTHLHVVLLPLHVELLVGAAVVVDLSDAVHAVHEVLLFVLYLEQSGDFVKSFVLCFWHFFVGEHPEYGEKNTERQERIIF